MLDDILIVSGAEIAAMLSGRERELINKVRMAYETHAKGASTLPHSTFLHFYDNPGNRIIALPAYLGGEDRAAGLKWVSSFPDNVRAGLDRASAVIILNSAQTGRPIAILEGSVISAKRTAASAALAAQCLYPDREPTRLGLIGCGLINFEIVRYLWELWPTIRTVHAFDLDPARVEQFKWKCQGLRPEVAIEIESDWEAVLGEVSLVSVATTALQPYLADLSGCIPGSIILHVSLRDLTPQAILSCDNIVDDVDHVCRAQTSIHLAEQMVGHRDFIRCTLADILRGKIAARKDSSSVTVFSPFGLGILDIAVGQFVRELAIEEARGLVINSFLPAHWTQAP